MRSSLHTAAHPKLAAARMIWVPGAYNAAEDFLRAGFAAAVARRGLSLDLEFVDLELRFWGDRGALEELRGSVILPLRAAGIAVWLAGISLGGLLALDFAASYAGDLAGLCLFAPYPGNRMLLQEIEQAPGLHNWQPGELAETDAERRIWRYLKSRRTDAAPLYLGFGKDDRFAAGLRLLAATLPADSVDVIDGAHDWGTWALLWENFLDSRCFT
jgi:pimeloyl-ACP methyl ester carboxylesterase